MRTRGSIFAAVCALALVVAVPLALAATVQEEARAQYKAAVEPICRENSQANQHILAGVAAKVRKGKLKAAGRQFVRASAALQRTLRQLEAVPRPEADAPRLTEWLKRVGSEATLLRKIGKALEAGQKRKAESLVARLESGARLTNAMVISFSFHYCRFEPSKYT
ncbi:MAG TPA: hypothetical protein VFP23_01100 [Solirubrobacterales bacterium]|nr:hypothetical protein [Solirubrobacterales bacterium]